MGMSVRAYSASRGANRKSVQRAITSGLIRLDAEGRVDPAQADATWGALRAAGRRHINTQADANAATARLAAAAGKLRLRTEKFEAMDQRYTDRQQAVIVATAEARYAITALGAAADDGAESFAAALAIEVEPARKILRQFVELVMLDLGDVEGQAQRHVELA